MMFLSPVRFMAYRASGTQSMELIATGSKRKSNDVGWEYCICPDHINLDKVQCIFNKTLPLNTPAKQERNKIQITY
ncbi:hypothetical protein LXL04_020967 [Taraxacum kok-saghyz]